MYHVSHSEVEYVMILDYWNYHYEMSDCMINDMPVYVGMDF